MITNCYEREDFESRMNTRQRVPFFFAFLGWRGRGRICEILRSIRGRGRACSGGAGRESGGVTRVTRWQLETTNAARRNPVGRARRSAKRRVKRR